MPRTIDDMTAADLLKMHHDDASGCCFAGKRYFADENGDVLVPAEAAAELLAHRFAPVPRVTTSVAGRGKPLPAHRTVKG